MTSTQRELLWNRIFAILDRSDNKHLMTDEIIVLIENLYERLGYVKKRELSSLLKTRQRSKLSENMSSLS